MELRTVLANLVTEFDIEFGPGEDGSDLVHKSQDVFATAVKPLQLVFKSRTSQ